MKKIFMATKAYLFQPETFLFVKNELVEAKDELQKMYPNMHMRSDKKGDKLALTAHEGDTTVLLFIHEVDCTTCSSCVRERVGMNINDICKKVSNQPKLVLKNEAATKNYMWCKGASFAPKNKKS